MTPPTGAEKAYVVRDDTGHLLGVPPVGPSGIPDQRFLMSRWGAHVFAAGAARAGMGDMHVVHWTPDGERTVEVHLSIARTREQTAARPRCCQRAREPFPAGVA